MLTEQYKVDKNAQNRVTSNFGNILNNRNSNKHQATNIPERTTSPTKIAQSHEKNLRKRNLMIEIEEI